MIPRLSSNTPLICSSDKISPVISPVGPTYNDEGDVVISEEEFVEIKHLKELKQTYRSNHDELKNLKAEVQYCQRLVDQCRQRLIQGETLTLPLALILPVVLKLLGIDVYT